MSTLLKKWSSIQFYLDAGISLIPVSDKDGIVNGRDVKYKAAFKSWDEYKLRKATAEELYRELEQYNTTFIAAVCGEVSGNLEVIDVDVKYKAGIDVLVLSKIKEFLPELYPKLRIHKSSTGGPHILYFLESKPNGNKKLALRYPTEAETKDAEYKGKKAKPKCFLETRAEGGYVVIPPSEGYTVFQDVPIPIITQQERDTIISICIAFNELIKEPKPFKLEKKNEDIYDENPFNHYSRTADPIPLLEQLDWKFVKKSGIYLWFTRPGKSSGVSGTFNLETRIFWSWSPNWDGEQEEGYYLSKLLVDVKFNKDAKAAYHWLVENGYGKLKRSVEEQIIKRNAISGKPPPENASDEGKKEYERIKVENERAHPYGTFWDTDNKGQVSISRQRLYEVSAKVGFRFYDARDAGIVQINDKFIHKRSKREYFDTMKDYIKINDPSLEDVYNSYEAFLQQKGEFTMERLELLNMDLVIKDTREKSHKFFKDSWTTITKKDVEINTYDTLDKLVFNEKVQDRPFITGEKGHYIEFLEYALQLKQNYKYILKIVGYLTHEYKDATTPYIIICTEQVEDPRLGGGSGKNLFCELLSFSTTFIDKPASQSVLDRNFFQSWNGEKVMAISDLPKDFNFEFFKQLTSGSATIKKLFRDERIETVQNLPKLICQTQYSFEIRDGGLKRRIIPLEFTDYFTKSQGVDTRFGIQFPSTQGNGEWNEEDWAGYDWFVHRAIQEWMNNDCKLHSNPLSDTGWVKQFTMIYGEIIVGIIEYYWHKWTLARFVGNDDFKKDLEDYYNFNSIYRPPTTNKINKALEDYATHNNVVYEKDFVGRDHLNNSLRGRMFTPLAD